MPVGMACVVGGEWQALTGAESMGRCRPDEVPASTVAEDGGSEGGGGLGLHAGQDVLVDVHGE